MGTVIRFPDQRRKARANEQTRERTATATVVILPVIRIERHVDSTTERIDRRARVMGGRRRRRTGQRS